MWHVNVGWHLELNGQLPRHARVRTAPATVALQFKYITNSNNSNAQRARIRNKVELRIKKVSLA